MAPRYEHKTFDRDEVFALPEYDGQRNTAQHKAKFVKAKGFNKGQPGMSRGFVVINVNGARTLGNGNTRRLMHQDGDISLPQKLDGDEVFCASLAEAQEVYKGLDSSICVKQATDRLTSALKVGGIKARTDFFKGGRGTTAIAIAYNALHGCQSNAAADADKMVATLQPEIDALDRLLKAHKAPYSGKCNVFTSPPFQAAVMMSLFRARLAGLHSAVYRATYEWWSDVFEYRGVAPVGLGGLAPKVIIWNRSASDLQTNSNRGTRSRKGWYESLATVLAIFERRDEVKIESVQLAKEIITTFCAYLKPKAPVVYPAKAPKKRATEGKHAEATDWEL